MLADLLLEGVFLWGLEDLAGLWVDQAAHGILFPDLLYLVRKRLDLVARVINIVSKLFPSDELILEEVPILLHGLILAVALAEHLKGARPICQVLRRASYGRYDHLINLHDLSIQGIHGLLGVLGFSRLLGPSACHLLLHHLEEGLALDKPTLGGLLCGLGLLGCDCSRDRYANWGPTVIT